MEHCAVLLILSNVANTRHLSVRSTSSVSQSPSITEDLRIVRNVLSIQTTGSRTIRTFFESRTRLNPTICYVNSSSCYTTKGTSNSDTDIRSNSGNTHYFKSTSIPQKHSRYNTRSRRQRSPSSIAHQLSSCGYE